MEIGQQMYGLAEKLFPICRSITGDGVRETLDILKSVIKEGASGAAQEGASGVAPPCDGSIMTVHNVPSGTEVFDWTVPKEWNIRDGYIAGMDGERIIDFKKNNLHIVGYSTPVDKIVTRDELLEHVYVLPEQPDYIPYVTSYYHERYGFCMSQNQKRGLDNEYYHIYIDSDLKDGYLTYGEIIIKGETEEEIFLSTYICHPSMANNELSGPCLAIYLAKWLLSLESRRYTYRIIFIPETIGSITYLSRNLDVMKRNVVAGFNLSCVGDDRCYSYVPSRLGNTLADRAALNALRGVPNLIKYTFLDRGSDERQYCSVGVDLPVCSILRSKHGRYPEYHTSADDMSLISPEGLEGAYNVYQKCIISLENNYKYRINCLCEPQLGKRGLYPDISRKGSSWRAKAMRDFIAYCDGVNDLIGISDMINVPVSELLPVVRALDSAGLLERTE